MELEITDGYEYKKEIIVLFKEYTDFLIKENNDFKECLKLQSIQQEVDDINKNYGRPNGRFYIALYNNQLAGCIGLKMIDNERCEMKRLYVKPYYRGKHIGSTLIAKVISDAKEIGYKSVLLDTFPFLKNAISIYKKLGFYETKKYDENPMKDVIYLKLDL